MSATLLATEGASNSATLLVGLACIALGVLGLAVWVDWRLWGAPGYVPRREMISLGLVLFGIALLVSVAVDG